MPIFIFSHYKSMATISCHSNKSSYPMARIGFMAPEMMLFDNVDDGWTTEG